MKQFISTFAFVILGSAVQAGKYPIVHNEVTKETLANQLGHLTNGFLKGEKFHVEDLRDWSYLVEVEVGTPPQKLMLAPDTITTDSWVLGKKCWSLPCFWQPLYDHSKSTSYLKDGAFFNKSMIDHVFGSAIGNFSQDTFTFGDLSVKDFKFGEITKVDGNDWVFNKASGVLGLAYSTSSQSINGEASFLHQANPQDKSFSLYLNNAPKESYMTIPGMDTDNYEVIKEHKVLKKEYFQMKVDHIKKGDAMFKNDDLYIGLLNGYEGIVALSTIFDPILDEVVVYKDCSNIDSLPDFTFTLDGVDYTLTGHDYVIKSRGQCVNGIASLDPYMHRILTPPNMVVLGNIFMKKYAPYFDMNSDTVSF